MSINFNLPLLIFPLSLRFIRFLQNNWGFHLHLNEYGTWINMQDKLKVPLKGKLKLPLPFVLEYGSSLLQKFFIELPTGEVWFGNYVKRSDYIEGLDDLISFYGIKPYHMVVMHYSGGPYFKFNIFNECGVEIFYPFSCNSSCNLRVRRNDAFSVVSSTTVLTEIEIDKMTATCSFNALHNFLGLHEILIQRSHLAEKSKYEVMSSISDILKQQ